MPRCSCVAGACGRLVGDRVLNCDRDRKWSCGSSGRKNRFRGADHVSDTMATSASCARSAQCLNQVIAVGERHLRRTPAEFVEHGHRESNHHGLDTSTGIRLRQRLGGCSTDYCRAA